MNHLIAISGLIGLSALALSVTALATTKVTPAAPEGLAKATFAAGCFWCLEKPFDELNGVISTTSGYTDGHTPAPSYKQVSSGVTGHTEAMEVLYDPKQVSYQQLLDVFWKNVDPTDNQGQFCDRGSQYRPGIYWHNPKQAKQAAASLAELRQNNVLDQPILLEIKPASRFYAAEAYHQDYYLKNPIRYKYYRWSCGRDARLKALWGND